MDERRYNQKLPWDDSIYGTGRTHPRKSHGGAIALLLILVIFLSGVVAFLSIMNVRLLNQLSDQPDQNDHPMIFSQQNSTEPEASSANSPTKSTEPEDSQDTIDLIPSPQSQDNIPQEGGLSLQDIYVRNLPSVVSITCQSAGGSTTGTGVILTDDGYIITNCHVVSGARAITEIAGCLWISQSNIRQHSILVRHYNRHNASTYTRKLNICSACIFKSIEINLFSTGRFAPKFFC